MGRRNELAASRSALYLHAGRTVPRRSRGRSRFLTCPGRDREKRGYLSEGHLSTEMTILIFRYRQRHLSLVVKQGNAALPVTLRLAGRARRDGGGAIAKRLRRSDPEDHDRESYQRDTCGHKSTAMFFENMSQRYEDGGDRDDECRQAKLKIGHEPLSPQTPTPGTLGVRSRLGCRSVGVTYWSCCLVFGAGIPWRGVVVARVTPRAARGSTIRGPAGPGRSASFLTAARAGWRLG